MTIAPLLAIVGGFMLRSHVPAAVPSSPSIFSFAIEQCQTDSADVPAADLLRFESWVQYAAAAYCHNNMASNPGPNPGHKLTCRVNNCPFVEQANTTVLLYFPKFTPTDTTGYLAVDHTHRAIVLAFGGEKPLNTVFEWDPILTETDLCRGCMVAKGFLTLRATVRAQALQAIAEVVVVNPDYEVVIVGHSLGAALATLAVANARETGYRATLYSYNGRRVGNGAFVEYVMAQPGNYCITHTVDPISKLPLFVMGYFHPSAEYWITAPDNTSVQADEIDVLIEWVNWQGNAGTGLSSPIDFHAHFWYFQNVLLCTRISL